MTQKRELNVFIHYICIPDEGSKKELKHCNVIHPRSIDFLHHCYCRTKANINRNFKTITVIRRGANATTTTDNKSITQNSSKYQQWLPISAPKNIPNSRPFSADQRCTKRTVSEIRTAAACSRGLQARIFVLSSLNQVIWHALRDVALPLGETGSLQILLRLWAREVS